MPSRCASSFAAAAWSILSRAAYRAFTSSLIGYLLLVVAQEEALAQEALDEGGTTPPNSHPALEDYPTILRLEDKLSEDHFDDEFESALENLLNRIDAMVSQ